MKKLFLFLLLIPIIGFGQRSSGIQIGDLLKGFGNPVAGYWSDEGELLFNGGNFNIKSADVAKVSTYVIEYGGITGANATASIIFDVLNDGSKQLSSIGFRPSMEGTMPQIYFDLNSYLGGDD